MKYQCPQCGCITGNPDRCDVCGSPISGLAIPVKDERKKPKHPAETFKSPASVMPTSGTTVKKAKPAVKVAPGKRPTPGPATGVPSKVPVAPVAKPPAHPIIRFIVLFLSIAAFFGSFWLAMWLGDNFDQAIQFSTSQINQTHGAKTIRQRIRTLIDHVKPQSPDPKTIIITVAYCNFRKYPEISGSNIMETLSRGYIAQLIGTKKVRSTLWYHIDFNHKKGWISEHVCRVISSKKSNIHVLANNSVFLRENPNSSSEANILVIRGELLQVLQRTAYWIKIRDEYGNIGYVPSGTLKFEPVGR